MSEENTKPKIALVTGAGRGIGERLRRALAKRWYACYLCKQIRVILRGSCRVYLRDGGMLKLVP